MRMFGRSLLTAIAVTVAVGILWRVPTAARTVPFAEFSNTQDAAYVIGQDDFITTNATAEGTHGANRLYFPRMIAVDPASGKVFVADTRNDRVLRFPSFDNLKNGTAAEMVFGQPDLTTILTNQERITTTLLSPRGLTVHDGDLYISDSNNGRVLRFADAATVTPTGSSPVPIQIIGQADYTARSYATNDRTLDDPVGLKFDADGNLYIADRNDGRVVRIDDAANRGDYPQFDAVFGQADFTTSSGGDAAGRLRNPFDVAIDAEGTLYIADNANDRVVIYRDAATADGAGHSASGVIGQSTLDSADTGQPMTASTVNAPHGVLIDSEGNLWVSDSENDRVLRFPAVTTDQIGGTADRMLGQPDFTASAETYSRNIMTTPGGIAADDEGTLYVINEYAHRVLAFRGVMPEPPAAARPQYCLQPAMPVILPDPLEIAPGGAATVWVELRNPCRDLPTAPADVLLSLSDGLRVIEVSDGVLNLGQRAALQRFSLAAGETRGWYAVVLADAPLPTAPLAIAEIYAGAAVVRSDTRNFITPAPAAPAEVVEVVEVVAAPVAAPAAAPAPLPAALPNTAGVLPLLWLPLVAGGLAAAGFAMRRRPR
jgi:DNA-binding beta-propeller fold protein YncE